MAKSLRATLTAAASHSDGSLQFPPWRSEAADQMLTYCRDIQTIAELLSACAEGTAQTLTPELAGQAGGMIADEAEKLRSLIKSSQNCIALPTRRREHQSAGKLRKAALNR